MIPKFYDYKRDGITQGLLATFMSCRQKTDWFLQGYSPKRASMSLTYGTIIHGVLEEVYNLIRLKKLTMIPSSSRIKNLIAVVEKKWYHENPMARKDAIEYLQLSLAVAESTLPMYFKFWWKQDFQEIKWKSLEQQFAIPYTTKDGRKTIIRGKKDGVYGQKTITLFETKTKSMINVGDLIETLWFELQVNLYLWALKKTYKQVPSGVNYNIIRKTSLKQKKGENLLTFSKRVAEDIKKRPEFYFIRLKISVDSNDMRNFENDLEGMVVDFMDWRDGKLATYKNTHACIDKYGRCPYLDLCANKDFSKYTKRKMVFRELEDY